MLGGGETTGVVARLEDDVALVEVRRQSGCGRCAEPGGCGKQAACPARAYRIPNRIGASVGDEVLVSVGEGHILRAALLSYGLCAALTVAFAAAGHAWRGGDDGSMAGAVLGLAAGLACMRIAQRRLAIRDGMRPTIRFSSRLVHSEEGK